MKDYFDLWVLLNDITLDLAAVRPAIQASFERRKMAMPAAVPVGLSDTFAEDSTKQAQWKGFLTKNRLESIALTDLVSNLRERLRVVGAF